MGMRIGFGLGSGLMACSSSMTSHTPSDLVRGRARARARVRVRFRVRVRARARARVRAS